MAKYEIQTENGNLMRVAVEHGILNPEPLYALQSKLSTALPEIKLKDRPNLHMTLFHFGLPNVLFEDMRRFNAKLGYEIFYSNFLALLKDTANVIGKPFSLQAMMLAKFGNPDEPVVVVELESPAWLEQKRQAVRARFEVFFTDCGIKDTDKFEDTVSYLDFQLERSHKPHVSLGKLPVDLPLPSIDVSGLTVQLSPSRLRNVAVKP